MRAVAVESGRQPSFGKRTQLIEDGLKNPKEHLSSALGLVNILSTSPPRLKSVTWRTPSGRRTINPDPNSARIRLLNALEILAKDPAVLKREKELKEGSSYTFKKEGSSLIWVSWRKSKTWLVWKIKLCHC